MGILFSNMKSPIHECQMTFWPLTSYSDVPTNQTYHQFYNLNTEINLYWNIVNCDVKQPIHLTKQKQKYRGMFETQKSRNKTSSGDIGLNIRTLASPKVGQDQVSGGVSVLCWHAAPVANVLWKPLAIRQTVKFGNKVKISNRVKNWCNAWSMEGVTVDCHHPECRVTFGRGGPHIVW